MDEPVNELRHLRHVKIGVFIMVAIFFAQLFHRTEYWPLTRWTMYANAGGPPATYSDYELTIITADGENYTLFTNDIGFIARRLIIRTIDETDIELQQVYRDLLAERAKTVLEKTEITKIEIWERTWQIHKWEVPPFDPEYPDERVQIDTFNVFNVQPTQEGA